MITYEKFIWARMVVSSRIFGVMMGGKKTDALVPIADMLNHKIPKMTSCIFLIKKRVSLCKMHSNKFKKDRKFSTLMVTSAIRDSC